MGSVETEELIRAVQDKPRTYSGWIGNESDGLPENFVDWRLSNIPNLPDEDTQARIDIPAWDE
jgi:hypothetical protein